VSARRVAALFVLAAGPVLAFDTSKIDESGSRQLKDVMPIIEQSPQLKAQVGKMVASSKQAESVVCFGQTFPLHWRHLGGKDVGPYICDFPFYFLSITTDVRVTDGKGKVYLKDTREARRNARELIETNPRWKWSRNTRLDGAEPAPPPP
jgi:hypothetical protein